MSAYAWFNGGVISAPEAHVPLAPMLCTTARRSSRACASTTPSEGRRRSDTDHVDRLTSSATLYYMTVPWSRDELREAANELVRVNGHRDCYLRTIVFRGTGTMNARPQRWSRQRGVTVLGRDESQRRPAGRLRGRACSYPRESRRPIRGPP